VTESDSTLAEVLITHHINSGFISYHN